MNDEQDKRLCEKYPLIFSNRYKDMKETPTSWGFECGKGWYVLIDVLCANIQHHINQSHEANKWDLQWNIDHPEKIRTVRPIVTQVVAEQVKEKFGSLRFYYSGGDDYIRGMTSFAESLSSTQCEECGSPSTIKDQRGWYSNICKVCDAVRETERAKLMKQYGAEE